MLSAKFSNVNDNDEEGSIGDSLSACFSDLEMAEDRESREINDRIAENI